MGGEQRGRRQVLEKLPKGDPCLEFLLDRAGDLSQQQGVEAELDELALRVDTRDAGKVLQNADDLGLQGLEARARGLLGGRRDVGRRRRFDDDRLWRCRAAGGAFDPMARALEAVGRQRDAPAATCTDRRPIERKACAQERGQRVAKVFGLRVGEARRDAADLAAIDGLGGQRRERTAGADFEQKGRSVAHHRRDGIGKAHRLAAMAGPVLGIRHLCRVGPVSADARHEAALRGGQDNACRSLRDGAEDRIERSRVKRMRHGQRPVHDAARVEACLEPVDVGLRARNDAQRGSVDRSDVERVAQFALELGLGQADCQHGTGRQRLHEECPRGDQPASLVEREDASDAGRDELADAVSHHRIGFEAPGHVETGQGVLEDEKRRLREQRCLAVRRRWIEELRAKLGADDRRGDGNALVHQLAEQRLVAMKGARHAGMLCALTREHEDQGRATSCCRCCCRSRGCGSRRPQHLDGFFA